MTRAEYVEHYRGLRCDVAEAERILDQVTARLSVLDYTGELPERAAFMIAGWEYFSGATRWTSVVTKLVATRSIPNLSRCLTARC